jgi:DNA-binding MarR family transcriptional regulator
VAKHPESVASGSANETEITLGLLTRVESDRDLTQRSVARDMDIALGLANAYLKRCVRKGFIKVRQIPPNRYAYYLTPNGFAEKSRLTAEYFSQSFNFFRRARSQCTELLDDCTRRGWNRVALAGASDLAEIAVLCAADGAVTLVGLIDPTADTNIFMGMPVVRDAADLDDVDALVITDITTSQATFDELVGVFPTGRVLAPTFLNIAVSKPLLME